MLAGLQALASAGLVAGASLLPVVGLVVGPSLQPATGLVAWDYLLVCAGVGWLDDFHPCLLVLGYWCLPNCRLVLAQLQVLVHAQLHVLDGLLVLVLMLVQ